MHRCALGWPQYKATLKCAVLLYWGGGGGNQLVSGVTNICLTQCNTSPSHRVDQVVDCSLWNVGPLLFNGCEKLLDIGRNWNTLSYTRSRASQTCSMGDMSGEYAGHARCFHLPGIVYRSLQHGAVHYHAVTWGDGHGWMAQQWASGPRHGISVQNAFKKMHLCSLSITYASPYHNPTATMGHSIHNVTSANRSPTRGHTRFLPSALYSENRDSSVKRTPLQSARCHRMWAFAHSSRLRRRTAVRLRPGRRACKWASLRRFLTVCAVRNSLVMQTDCCSSCPGGWSQTILEVKMLVWLHVVCGCGQLDVLPNSLKRLWRRLMVEKWTFNSPATALVDIPAVSMPIARSLKTCDICGIVLCDKTAHFRVAFYCGQPKAHLCNNHANV